MPSAPDVVMTPAPNRLGKPCRTIAGSMIEPIAITVAGDDPDTAANSAQAITPARPRPPCQCPTMEVAKLIMRRATPPWVRKLPARMKNGIAMISNFSMPVNSFSATESSGTVVSVNKKVSTVRPSEIEIGMPVIISATSSRKISATRRPGRIGSRPNLAARQARRITSGAAMMSMPPHPLPLSSARWSIVAFWLILRLHEPGRSR
jgi:hypothetical protein